MFFLRIKHFVITFLAVVLVLICGFGVLAMNTVKLNKHRGDRVFYLYSASSQGTRTEELSFKNFFQVKGESVTFCLDEKKSAKETAREIAETYNAKICFIEEACGVTSYYCYTTKWSNETNIGGVKVNLHVAVSAETVSIGTPIIFDGY